jgi:hypothetical protein
MTAAVALTQLFIMLQFKGQIRDLNKCVIMVSSVYGVQRWAVVNKVMNLQVPYESGDMLTK